MRTARVVRPWNAPREPSAERPGHSSPSWLEAAFGERLYLVQLGDGELGVGWLGDDGQNRFVVISEDLQSASSQPVSFAGAVDAVGAVASAGLAVGEDVLVIGSRPGSPESGAQADGMTATLRCTATEAP